MKTRVFESKRLEHFINLYENLFFMFMQASENLFYSVLMNPGCNVNILRTCNWALCEKLSKIIPFCHIEIDKNDCLILST